MSALVAVLVGSLGARAQVNAEALSGAARSPGFGAEVGVRGALVTGNLDLVDATGSLSLHRRTTFQGEGDWMRDRALLVARGAYRNINRTVFLDQRLVHGRYTRMLVRRIGIDAFAQLDNDRVRRLRARWVIGLGGSAIVVRRRGLEAWAGLAAMAEFERRDVPPEGPDAVRTFNPRASAYASWTATFADARVSWTQTAYLQPRVDAPTDLQWLLDGALRIPVSRVVSQVTGVVVRGDTRPPAEVEPIDVTVTFGVDLRFAPPATRAPAPP
ncbi:MAG: DUF481 domain-containing protein [Myxococcota bacterium]